LVRKEENGKFEVSDNEENGGKFEFWQKFSTFS
jgi:hypothetical protein